MQMRIGGGDALAFAPEGGTDSTASDWRNKVGVCVCVLMLVYVCLCVCVEC